MDEFSSNNGSPFLGTSPSRSQALPETNPGHPRNLPRDHERHPCQLHDPLAGHSPDAEFAGQGRRSFSLDRGPLKQRQQRALQAGGNLFSISDRACSQDGRHGLEIGSSRGIGLAIIRTRGIMKKALSAFFGSPSLADLGDSVSRPTR